MVQRTAPEQMDEMDDSVVLYHVEDREDWQTIVQRRLDRLQRRLEQKSNRVRLIYTHSPGPLRNATRTLARIHEPTILLIDLRLNHDRPTEYETLKWLVGGEGNLLHRGIEVFVISGFLPDGASLLLEEQGIPCDHVYDKAGWVEGEEYFLDALEQALKRVRSRHALLASRNPVVYEIEARIPELDEGNGPIVAQKGIPYKMEIVVRSLEAITHFPHLVGDPLDVLIDCPGAVLAPGSQAEIPIPKPGEEGSADFKITFPLASSARAQQVKLLLYHGNHLLRVIRFDVAF